ncbi:toprim domain-containing protein [Methanopyrus kandleri]
MARDGRRKSPVDVRIIVEGAADAETISKVIQRMALGGEYNIKVTSIIHTTHAHIARRTAEGADLVLIATDADKPGRKLAKKFQEELRGVVGRVERVKMPIGHDVEHVDLEIVEKELRSALVRAGLKSLRDVKELREEIKELQEEIEEKEELIEELKEKESELEELRERLKEIEKEKALLEEERDRLLDEVERLRDRLEELEEELESDRLRIMDIESVCEEAELSPEDAEPEVLEELGEELEIPIVVGSTRIAAPSREDAVRVLKIYKLARKVVDGEGEKENETTTEDPEV